MSNAHDEENPEWDEADAVEDVSAEDVVEPAPESGDAAPEEAADEDAADEDAAGEDGDLPEDPARQAEKWREVAARAQAELENYRKRMVRERTEAVQYANRNLLEQLLPIIDNFEMGLKAAYDAEGDSSMIYQGMAMVRKQLEDFLANQGVEPIESDGLAFDPNVHEAVGQESHDSAPEGQVIRTIRRGYRLKDRLLRAASVVVSSGPENA